MRVVSLASGSSGNSLLVEAGPHRRTKLLVDAGLGGRLLTTRLREVGVHPANLQGVLITHEHSDHVLGLPTLMKRHAVPVIADPRTYQVIETGLSSGYWRTDSGRLISTPADDAEPVPLALPADPLLTQEEGGSMTTAAMQEETALFQHTKTIGPTRALPVGEQCVIGDIEVQSFPTSHDAVAPCGYLLSAGGCRVCVITDSGEVTQEMLDKMRLADLLVLEANHDRERLLRGPYPISLKQRILGAQGHLSNDQAAKAVLQTWRVDSVRWIWLAHLSRTNNTPTLALKSMREHIQKAGASLTQVHISVSPPNMGPVWDSTQLWHSPTLWDMGL